MMIHIEYIKMITQIWNRLQALLFCTKQGTVPKLHTTAAIDLKQLIVLEKESEFKFLVKTTNSGKGVGIFVCDINGEYYFRATTVKEYWSSNALHAIALHLEDLNKGLNQEMTSYFI